jgi:hypothetical protein
MDSEATSPQPSSSRGSCLRSALAFIVLGITGGALLILPTGFIGPVFVLGGGFLLAVFAFHYLVWGRLMNLELPDRDESVDE